MIRAPETAYRAHKPEWASDPLSGRGAELHGGRFNRPGVAALYLGLTYQTAVLEANQGFARKLPPTTIVTYDIDCEDIVDLTKPSERAHWNIRPAQLRCGWITLAAAGNPVPTWELADRLIAAKAAGILVQSFAPGATDEDINLVLWKWGPRRPHRVRAYDPNGSLAKLASRRA